MQIHDLEKHLQIKPNIMVFTELLGLQASIFKKKLNLNGFAVSCILAF